MIKKGKYISLFILLINLILIDANAQGLQFHANNDLIESRTSYNVFAKETPVFKNFFEISFDLSVNVPKSFGYILYVKDEISDHNYNLVYTYEDDSSSYLKFSIDNKEIPLSVKLSEEKLGKRKWLNVSIKFNSASDSIEFIVNNDSYRMYTDFSSKKFRPVIFFGKHGSFIDVPDISIRNLKISDINSSYSFNFNEIKGSEVHDLKGTVRGVVENPIWLINESFFWKQRFHFASNQVTAINYDSKMQRFILINTDSVYFYNITKGTFTGYELPQETPVPLRLGLSFFSDENEKLTVYEVNDADFNKPSMASINLNTFDWEDWSFDQLDKQSHHHISYFDQEKEEFVIFGGYGNKEYFNDFYSISKIKPVWEKVHFSGDTITPRFFSGATKLNDHELIIFGGAGNPSGQQSAGKIYYTDCYRVNLKTRTIKKLWNSDAISTNMVSGTNLILSPDSSHFYTIYYPEYVPNTFLKLYSFSLENGEHEILGDSIPMVSERIRTNANLYFNKDLNELYCVTQEFKLDGASSVKIFSISYPPVSAIDYFSDPSNSKKYGFIYLVFILTIAVVSILWVIYKNKKKLDAQKSILLDAQKSVINIDSKNGDIQEKQHKNSVYVFGAFKVFNKNGKEISYLFSPKIQQIFLLIFLNSDENRVTSREIYSVLWPEKPIEKAKNSKGVVLNQLRKIVADIEGLELKNKNRQLYFETADTFYCDYLDFLTHLKQIKLNENTDEGTINKLISIVSHGRFLQFIDFEYFDKIKQDFENEVLLIIPFQLEKYFREKNYAKVIQLCKIIYNIDLINELALQFELISYAKLNLTEKAKKRFNSFSFEYKKELNEDYGYTFSDLINRDIRDIIKET